MPPTARVVVPIVVMGGGTITIGGLGTITGGGFWVMMGVAGAFFSTGGVVVASGEEVAMLTVESGVEGTTLTERSCPKKKNAPITASVTTAPRA